MFIQLRTGLLSVYCPQSRLKTDKYKPIVTKIPQVVCYQPLPGPISLHLPACAFFGSSQSNNYHWECVQPVLSSEGSVIHSFIHSDSDSFASSPVGTPFDQLVERDSPLSAMSRLQSCSERGGLPLVPLGL